MQAAFPRNSGKESVLLPAAPDKVQLRERIAAVVRSEQAT